MEMFVWIGYALLFLFCIGVLAIAGCALLFALISIICGGLVLFDKIFPNRLKDHI